MNAFLQLSNQNAMSRCITNIICQFILVAILGIISSWLITTHKISGTANETVDDLINAFQLYWKNSVINYFSEVRKEESQLYYVNSPYLYPVLGVAIIAINIYIAIRTNAPEVLSAPKSSLRCTCVQDDCVNCKCVKGKRACMVESCHCKGKCRNPILPSSIIPVFNEPLPHVSSREFYDLSTQHNSAQIILFLGKPKSGKTYAIKSIMHQFNNFFSFGLLFTGTAFTGDFEYLGRNCKVYDGWDEKSLEKHIKGLRKEAEEKKQRDKKYLMDPNYVIIDDLFGLINHKSSFFMNWITTFRHTNTWIFFTAQTLHNGTSPTLCKCMNYVFMFNSANHSEIEILFKNFCGTFERKQDFKRCFNQVTSSPPNTALLYDSSGKSETEYFKSFRASVIESNFIMNYRNVIPEVGSRARSRSRVRGG